MLFSSGLLCRSTCKRRVGQGLLGRGPSSQVLSCQAGIIMASFCLVLYVFLSVLRSVGCRGVRAEFGFRACVRYIQKRRPLAYRQQARAEKKKGKQNTRKSTTLRRPGPRRVLSLVRHLWQCFSFSVGVFLFFLVAFVRRSSVFNKRRSYGKAYYARSTIGESPSATRL